MAVSAANAAETKAKNSQFIASFFHGTENATTC
jgi:hypothetical protein